MKIEKPIESDISSIETPPSEPKPVVEPKVETPVVETPPVEAKPEVTLEQAMGKIVELEAQIKALSQKPVEANVVVSVPSVPPIEEPKIVEAPKVEEAPKPAEPTPVPETRGKVPPPTQGEGLNLIDLHRMTWDQLSELAPDKRRL